MYLLKKAIELREKSHPDHEKPFLEHLEDMRVMIIRIVVTLIIAMIACFAFNNKIMGFFRRPVEQVLLTEMAATLPDHAPRPLTTDLWKEAVKVEHSATGLNPEQREVYYRFLKDDNVVFHAKSISLLRAAMSLPEERRENFVASLNEPSELKDQIKSLLKSKPNTETQAHGNLNMMSALKPTEGFMLSMKLSFVAGIVVSFPLLLLFILQFILPGLHSHEKRVLWPAMTIGFGLFLAGSSFAYYLILPRTLLFFYQWSEMSLAFMYYCKPFFQIVLSIQLSEAVVLYVFREMIKIEYSVFLSVVALSFINQQPHVWFIYRRSPYNIVTFTVSHGRVLFPIKTSA